MSPFDLTQLKFDRFYRYDDLSAILHAFAETYPERISVQSIGKSYEGRDIWLVTATNTQTGEDSDKPAYWVDGNIHASEVSPSTACLYLIHQLATRYGEDDNITRVMDTRAFYICPRINPDGAEWALADTPKIIRSSTRPYPYDEDPIDGLTVEDVDGDGRMLFMRIQDPNGQWKAHDDDPRLMIRRDPTEIGGTYYRIMPEGTLKDYDGVTVKLNPNKEGLDINRNFPANWRQSHLQPGAGEYPTSEPEVRAVVDFVARHRNINGGTSFHTFSGVLLRPFGDKPDQEMPAEDLWVYEKQGTKGTELIGYPNISIFHEFRYHPKQVISGGFDWIYEHLGMFMWAVEIWSPQKQAGIEEYKYIDWYREHPIEDDLKMMQWSDEVLEGKGYIDWYSFDHPQLGQVELGGWDMQYAWRNPPPQFLEAEVAPFTDWLVWMNLTSPKLELYDINTTKLDDDTYQIRAVVHNTGWLPTFTSQQALARKIVRGVIAEIALPDGATLIQGKAREELGQLMGRSHTTQTIAGFAIVGTANTNDRAKVEWVVHAPKGGTINIVAKHERAGTVNTEVSL